MTFLTLIDFIREKYELARENFPASGIILYRKPGIYACFSRF
jgi:hypothetical protein